VSIGGGGVVSGRGAKREGYPVNLIDNLFISSNIGETDSPVVQGNFIKLFSKLFTTFSNNFNNF